MGLARRSFLVLAGGTILGRFALPGGKQVPGSRAKSVSSDVIVPTAEELARARRIISSPQWSEDKELLSWLEERDEDDDSSGLMMWCPNTPKEREEAERFCAACNHRTWTTYEELACQPRKRGRFVIRWILHPRVAGYLQTNEPPFIITDNLREAAGFDHSTAIDLIPRVMEDYEQEESSEFYFDTIPFTDAARSDLEYLQSKAK